MDGWGQKYLGMGNISQPTHLAGKRVTEGHGAARGTLTSTKQSPTSPRSRRTPLCSRTSAAFSERVMQVKSNMSTSGRPRWLRANSSWGRQ